MFTVTYQKVVEREQLGPSLSKLFNCQQLDQKTSYSAWKIIKKMQQAAKEFGEKIQVLNLKYAKKDEAGKPIPHTDEKGNKGYEIPDDQAAAYNEEVNALLSTEIEIQQNKLELKGLAKAQFSPKDYEVLEFMIEGELEGA